MHEMAREAMRTEALCAPVHARVVAIGPPIAGASLQLDWPGPARLDLGRAGDGGGVLQRAVHVPADRNDRVVRHRALQDLPPSRSAA
jgi:hypothetical protein